MNLAEAIPKEELKARGKEEPIPQNVAEPFSDDPLNLLGGTVSAKEKAQRIQNWVNCINCEKCRSVQQKFENQELGNSAANEAGAIANGEGNNDFDGLTNSSEYSHEF